MAEIETGCKLRSLIIGGNLIEGSNFVEVCWGDKKGPCGPLVLEDVYTSLSYFN